MKNLIMNMFNINEKDIEEVSAEIKKGLEIVFVEQIQEVLDVALVK